MDSFGEVDDWLGVMNTTMRTLAINLRHGGGRRIPLLLSFLAANGPDTIVLTEYRKNPSGRELTAQLRLAGYTWQEMHDVEPKTNSVCVVSRQPFEPITLGLDDWPERHRLLAVRFSEYDLVAVYFPHGERKRPVFDRLVDEVLPRLRARAVVLGDFNTGLPFHDERGNTFACVDSFERLLRAGVVDSWRQRNPERREFSWYSTAKNGFRIDHALCTPSFDKGIQGINYLHGCRENGATDHSSLLLQHDA
jgi:exonuclease III